MLYYAIVIEEWPFCKAHLLPLACEVRGKVMFWHESVCLSTLAGGGVPHPRSGVGGYPGQVFTGWGTPPPSIASTCYAAGGMPLAFTQEDFLVISRFLNNSARACHMKTHSESKFYTCFVCLEGFDRVRIFRAYSMAFNFCFQNIFILCLKSLLITN